jgi:hypothetical protein
MRWPTDEQLDRAVELVARVAQIPGLEKGGVILPADAPDHVERWQEEGGWNYDPHTQLAVELPFPFDDEDRLRVAARRRVFLAVGERQDELAEWVKQLKESNPDAANKAAAAMYEEVPAKFTAIEGGK